MIDALKGGVTNLTGAFLLLFLLIIGVASNDLLLSIVAVVLAIGITALVCFGPERMGIGLVVLGMFSAPMNAIGLAGGVAVSDGFFVFGFGLLIPRLLSSGRVKLPPLYVIGAGILFTGGIISSLLAPGVTESLVGFVKIIAATMVLVFVLNLMRPSPKLLDALAWAYVLGQGVSTVYSVGFGPTAQGRAIGLTSQPNFYGLGGQMAFALLVFLYYRTAQNRRWFVLGSMAVILFSVVNSGSRASLLCCGLIVILWPIIERSAIAWYVVVSGALIAFLTADRVLTALGQRTVLDRLSGNTSSSFSDLARENLLDQGLVLFWKHPLQGNGWGSDTILAFHNAYLQVAVGGGVLTLVGFVLVMAALIRPLFNQGGPNRLAYAGLSYAAFGMIGPTLYDRIVWAALALILVSSANLPPGGDPDAAEEDTGAESDRLRDSQPRRRPR